MSKMRAMQHNSRANSAGRVHGTKHNDRDFDTELAENIDATKSPQNIYWHLYQETNPEMTFTEAELRFYIDTFGTQLQQTNDRYLAQSHPERCKDMATWKQARRNAPEETVLQIGKMEEHVEPEVLMACFKEYDRRLEGWNEAHGRPFTQLTYALHVDEAVPHIQTRRVWHYRDENGIMKIGQEKALAAAGVELPDPNWHETRKNNRKVAFDKMAREMWLDVLHEHGLDIERVAVPDGKHNREKEEMIRDKYNEMLEQTEALMEVQADAAACEIETQPVMLRPDEVKVKKAELEALTEQAKAYVAGRTHLDELKQQLRNEAEARQAVLDLQEKKLRDERSSLAVDRVHIKNYWAELDRAEKTFREEKKSFETQRAELEKREAAVQHLEGLSIAHEELKKEYTALEARYLALKTKFEEKVKEVTAPLEKAVKSLTERCKRMAEANWVVVRALKYVKERFAGEVGAEILQSTYRAGSQWLKEDGFEELSEPAADLPKAIRFGMTMPLEFRNGDEGKGVYSPKGSLVMACSSAKEARELFPNAAVTDRTRSTERLR